MAIFCVSEKIHTAHLRNTLRFRVFALEIAPEAG